MKKSLLFFLLFSAVFVYGQQYAQITEREGKKCYIHTVADGNNLYGLQQMYACPAEDILNMNPGIERGFTTGEVVFIPVQRRTVKHIVAEKETLYAISRMYDVAMDSIVKYNPKAKNGLLLNQRLTIPNAVAKIQTDQLATSTEVRQQEIPKPSVVAQSKFKISFSDAIVSHVVLPQESLYTLSKRFMVPVPELQALNNLKSSRVNPGQTVKIPIKKEKVERVQIRPVPPKQEVEEKDELQFQARKSFEIALFLPLNLDSTSTYNRFVSNAALEYYMGAKLAMDSLDHLGLNATFHVYDYESASENLTAILEKPELLAMDVIFSPLQQREAELVSAFARKNELTIAFPVAMKESELIGNPNAICLSPSSSNLMEQMALSVHQHFIDQTVVLIKGESEADMKLDQLFLTAFRNVPSSVSKAKIIEATWKNYKQYEFMNENIIYVVLSTDKAKVLSLLEKYKSNQHVHIFGLKEWLEWKEVSGTIENTYAFTYASPTYFSYHSPSVMAFHKKYRRTYSSDLTRMACLGYDATLMICRQLISQTSKQTGIISNYQLIQQGVGNGFQNTAGYILDYKGFESKPE
jgi:LysM repeat protein